MRCKTKKFGKKRPAKTEGGPYEQYYRKKIFFVVALLLSVVLFSAEAKAEKKIGVILWSEADRFVESKQGVLDHLKKSGFGEPAVKYTIENAGGSKVKAMKLAQNFAAAKMDLIITLGTPATVVVVKEIKDVPIVFTMVYDAIEAGIVADLKKPGSNVTGVNTGSPMSTLMDILKKFAPVKKLAVLYTPGEKQTEIQLKELLKLQASSQIMVVPVSLTNKEEVARILPEVVRTADSMYLTDSSIVVATAPIILDIANKAKVVTITHVEELVDKGALLGVCPNAYLAGHQAGTKAVKILKGAKPSSIPIGTVKQYDVILNMKTAKAGQFHISPAFLKRVTKTVE